MSIPNNQIYVPSVLEGAYGYVVLKRGKEWIAVSAGSGDIDNLSNQGFSIFDVGKFVFTGQYPIIMANSPKEAVNKVMGLVEQKVAQLKKELAFWEGKSG